MCVYRMFFTLNVMNIWICCFKWTSHSLKGTYTSCSVCWFHHVTAAHTDDTRLQHVKHTYMFVHLFLHLCPLTHSDMRLCDSHWCHFMLFSLNIRHLLHVCLSWKRDPFLCTWGFFHFFPVKGFWEFFLIRCKGLRTEGVVYCTDCDVKPPEANL